MIHSTRNVFVLVSNAYQTPRVNSWKGMDRSVQYRATTIEGSLVVGRIVVSQAGAGSKERI